MSQLNDRIVLITGGATGIGRAVALKLAADGASIAINHLDDERSHTSANAVVNEIAAMGGVARSFPGDVTDRGDMTALVESVRSSLGTIGIVIANAAVAVAGMRPWNDISHKEWLEVLDVNIFGVYNTVQVCYEALVASGHGCVIVMSSVVPLLGKEGNLHYVTSKSALIGFTRALAREVGKDGVRVNAIAPGAIQTPSEDIYGSQEEILGAVLQVQSLQRRGIPPDVANVTSFLASDDASFITGQLLVVDGGWVMH